MERRSDKLEMKTKGHPGLMKHLYSFITWLIGDQHETPGEVIPLVVKAKPVLHPSSYWVYTIARPSIRYTAFDKVQNFTNQGEIK